MLKYISFLYILTATLVSPNPIFQRPVGTWQCQGNQGTTIPIQLSNRQITSQPTLGTCNSCNAQPFNQDVTYTISNDVQKNVVRQLLTNPAVQGVINQCAQNLTPLQNAPASVMPNIINNYFIVSPKVFEESTKTLVPNHSHINGYLRAKPGVYNELRNNRPIETNRKTNVNIPQNLKSQSNSQFTNKDCKRIQPLVNSDKNTINQNQRKSCNSNQKIVNEVIDDTQYLYDNFNGNYCDEANMLKRSHAENNNNKKTTEKNHTVKKIESGNLISPKPIKDIEDKKQLNRVFNEPLNQQMYIMNEFTTTKPQKNSSPYYYDPASNGAFHKPNKSQKLQSDDEIVQDVLSKHPEMPIDTLRSVVEDIKTKLQTPQNSNVYYPHMHNAWNYNDFYQNFIAQYQNMSKNYNHNGRHRPSLKRKSTNQTKSSQPIVANITNNDNTINTTDNLTSTENPTTNVNLQEPPHFVLGAEDKLPPIDENGIGEDYFPDFAKDNLAYSLHRDLYETDSDYYDDEIQRNERRIHPDQYTWGPYVNNNQIKSSKPFQFNGMPRFRFKKKRKNKQVDNKKGNEATIFQHPPGLEVADFKTVQINKGSNDHYNDMDSPVFVRKLTYEEVSTPSSETEIKSSTYSYAKPIYVSGHKHLQNDNVSFNEHENIDDVETVFANSKISKYGQKSSSAIEDSKKHLHGFDDEIRYSVDGDTTIVIAKSIDDDYDW